MIALTEKETRYSLIDKRVIHIWITKEVPVYLRKLNIMKNSSLEKKSMIFIERSKKGKPKRFLLDRDLLKERIERRIEQEIEREIENETK